MDFLGSWAYFVSSPTTVEVCCGQAVSVLFNVDSPLSRIVPSSV